VRTLAINNDNNNNNNSNNCQSGSVGKTTGWLCQGSHATSTMSEGSPATLSQQSLNMLHGKHPPSCSILADLPVPQTQQCVSVDEADVRQAVLSQLVGGISWRFGWSASSVHSWPRPATVLRGKAQTCLPLHL